MIKIENTRVVGFEDAIRGMRNPMNSWEKSDSLFCRRGECEFCPTKNDCGSKDLDFDIGSNDYELMSKLAKAGSVHAKYRRMINVYVDITAPLYWWKEFDTYKVGTVANSCSTMHKIHEKRFTIDDFSTDNLIPDVFECGVMETVLDNNYDECRYILSPVRILEMTIDMLNTCRNFYLKNKDKKYWWQMIQLLPSSYNQKRTVMLNYEVLSGIYIYRKDHKLDEWREFCKWIDRLPYSEFIFGENDSEED